MNEKGLVKEVVAAPWRVRRHLQAKAEQMLLERRPRNVGYDVWSWESQPVKDFQRLLRVSAPVLGFSLAETFHGMVQSSYILYLRMMMPDLRWSKSHVIP